jgi:glycosyltransferase involved in cell wall biosynthesis
VDPESAVAPAVLVLNWRDTLHPEGGGSERYVERIARGLVERGYRVTVFCARHENAPARQEIDGVRFVRRGTKITVYLYALLAVLTSRADVIVDVQNGVPFFSRLVTRTPVVVLLHHLHRHQWVACLGRVLGRIGWWVESRLAPVVYWRCRYVTVSQHTRDDLVRLGIGNRRITVVPNGLTAPPPTSSGTADEPLLVAVSRLQPHKRLEHAIDVLVRLRERWPTLRLSIIGRGPWHDRLRRYAEERGVADRVTLHGWLSEQDKHELLARAWVHLCPSAKEGWGISVMEAAALGVPSVAYHEAGGVCESIRDRRTGLLAKDFDDFVASVDRLLREPGTRAQMSVAGRLHARKYDWEHSVDAFETVLVRAAGLAVPRPLPVERAVPRQRLAATARRRRYSTAQR